jgi:hypothetical protein
MPAGPALMLSAMPRRHHAADILNWKRDRQTVGTAAHRLPDSTDALATLLTGRWRLRRHPGIHHLGFRAVGPKGISEGPVQGRRGVVDVPDGYPGRSDAPVELPQPLVLIGVLVVRYALRVRPGPETADWLVSGCPVPTICRDRDWSAGGVR